jgi:hypothetical protein
LWTFGVIFEPFDPPNAKRLRRTENPSKKANQLTWIFADQANILLPNLFAQLVLQHSIVQRRRFLLKSGQGFL